MENIPASLHLSSSTIGRGQSGLVLHYGVIQPHGRACFGPTALTIHNKASEVQSWRIPSGLFILPRGRTNTNTPLPWGSFHVHILRKIPLAHSRTFCHLHVVDQFDPTKAGNGEGPPDRDPNPLGCICSSSPFVSRLFALKLVFQQRCRSNDPPL